MSTQVTVSFKNQLSEIERLGQIVTEFAERHQWSPRILFEMNVAEGKTKTTKTPMKSMESMFTAKSPIP